VKIFFTDVIVTGPLVASSITGDIGQANAGYSTPPGANYTYVYFPDGTTSVTISPPPNGLYLGSESSTVCGGTFQVTTP
jgi:hypothetical protein